MCGRIVWRFDAKLQQWIKSWLDDDAAFEAISTEPQVGEDRYNITPGSRLPVAVRQGDAPAIALVKWAFPLDDGRYIFNTRIEKAFTSPMWRGPMRKARCVFPVTGFYEWKKAGSVRQPFYFHAKDDGPLLMAGVTGWRTHRGGELLCGSIVTCPPNGLLAKLHDRMPVLLDASGAKAWLDPQSTDAELMALAVPAGDVLAAHPVARNVNDQASEGPALIHPLPTLGDPLA